MESMEQFSREIPDLYPLYRDFYQRYRMDCKHNLLFADAGTGQGKTYSFLYFVEMLLAGEVPLKKIGEQEKDFRAFYLYPNKLYSPEEKIHNGKFPHLEKAYSCIYGVHDALQFFIKDAAKAKSKNENIQTAIHEKMQPFFSYCKIRLTDNHDIVDVCQEAYDECVSVYALRFLSSGTEKQNFNIPRGKSSFIEEEKNIWRQNSYNPMLRHFKSLLKMILKVNSWEKDFSPIFGTDQAEAFQPLLMLFPTMQLFNPKKKVFLMTVDKAILPLQPLLTESFSIRGIRNQYKNSPLILLCIDEVDQFINVYNKKRYQMANENTYGLIELTQVLLQHPFHWLSKVERIPQNLTKQQENYLQNQQKKLKRYYQLCEEQRKNYQKQQPFFDGDFKFSKDYAGGYYLSDLGYQNLFLNKNKKKTNVSTGKEYIVPYTTQNEETDITWAAHNEIGIYTKKPKNKGSKLFQDFLYTNTNFVFSEISKFSTMATIYKEYQNALASLLNAERHNSKNKSEDIPAISYDEAVNSVLNGLGLYDYNTGGKNPYVDLVKKYREQDNFGYRKDAQFLFIPAIRSYFNRGFRFIWNTNRNPDHYQRDDVSLCNCVSSCENFFLNLLRPLKTESKVSDVLIWGLSATCHFQTILTNLNFEYCLEVEPELFYEPPKSILEFVRQRYQEKNRYTTPGQEVTVTCHIADQSFPLIITDSYQTKGKEEEIRDEFLNLFHFNQPMDLIIALQQADIPKAQQVVNNFFNELRNIISHPQMNIRTMQHFCSFLGTIATFYQQKRRSAFFFNTSALQYYQEVMKKMAVHYLFLKGILHTKAEYDAVSTEIVFLKSEDLRGTTFHDVLYHLAIGGRRFIVTAYASGGRAFDPIYPAPYEDLRNNQIHCIGDAQDVASFQRQRDIILNAGKDAYQKCIEDWNHDSKQKRGLLFIDFQCIYVGIPTQIFPQFPERKKGETFTIPNEFIQHLDYYCRMRGVYEISYNDFCVAVKQSLQAILNNKKSTFFKTRDFESVKVSQLQIITQALGRLTRTRYRYKNVDIFLNQNLCQNYPWVWLKNFCQLGENPYATCIADFVQKQGDNSTIPSYEDYLSKERKKKLIAQSNHLSNHIVELVDHFNEEEDKEVAAIGRQLFEDIHEHSLELPGTATETAFFCPSVQQCFHNVYFPSLTGKPINKRYFRRQIQKDNYSGRFIHVLDVSDTFPQDNTADWEEISAEALQLPAYATCRELQVEFQRKNIPVVWGKSNNFILPSWFEQVCKGRIGEVVMETFLTYALGCNPQSLPPRIYEVFDRTTPEYPGVYFDAKFMTQTSWKNFVISEDAKQHIQKKMQKIIQRGYELKGLCIMNMRLPKESLSTEVHPLSKNQTAVIYPMPVLSVKGDSFTVPVLFLSQVFMHPDFSGEAQGHLIDNISIATKHKLIDFLTQIYQ